MEYIDIKNKLQTQSSNSIKILKDKLNTTSILVGTNSLFVSSSYRFACERRTAGSRFQFGSAFRLNHNAPARPTPQLSKILIW